MNWLFFKIYFNDMKYVYFLTIFYLFCYYYCGDRPRIISWLGPRPAQGPVLPKRHRGPGNPYLGPLGQREHVRGVIPPQTLQNPDQGCVQATIVHFPNT